MITSVVHEAIFLKVENKRKSYEPYAYSLLRKALNKQVSALIAAVRAGATDPLKSVSNKPIQDAFLQIYPFVGVEFALETYRDLIQLKAQEPISQWQVFMRRYVTTVALDRIKNIASGTIERARIILGIAVKEGYGIEKTAALLSREFAIINRIRARRIARTEIVSASNRGSLLGAESTGLKLIKIWLATPGLRTRPTHKAANGQKRALKKYFVVGGSKLEHPGDPKAAAKEVVNCRCTQIYEPV